MDIGTGAKISNLIEPSPDLSSSRLVKILRIASHAILWAIFLAYAGLIGLGRWQLDEYYFLYWIRHGITLGQGLQRLQYSPRFLSEPLYFLYLSAVNVLHRPLIVPFLGVLWAGFLVAGVLTSWQKRGETKSAQTRQNLSLISVTLLVLCLCSGYVTEVFYWPAGAVAYVPTVAASLLLFLQVIDNRLESRSGRILASICLLVAAGSSETGATFVLFYGLICTGRWAVTLWRKQKTSAFAMWWAIPAIAAIVSLIVVRLNRYYIPEAVTGPSNAGNAVASLKATIPEMIVEIFGRETLATIARSYPDPHTWLHFGLRIPFEILLGSRVWMEVLLAAGVALCWSPVGRISKDLAKRVLELVAAFVLASIATIAASNLQFGITCCARHVEVRECWIELAIVGSVIASSAWTSEGLFWRRSKYAGFGPVLLCASVLSLGSTRLLFETHRAYGVLRRAASENFVSGSRRDTKEMVFYILPSVGVIKETELVSGTYVAHPLVREDFGMRAFPYYILGFFGKRTVRMVQLTEQVPSKGN